MKSYRYEALDAEGNLVSGLIEADGERKAHRLLARRNLAPTNILEARALASKTRRRRKSNQRERILAIKELAILIDAGVQLADAIASLAASRAEEDLRVAFEGVARDLRQGQSMVAAFRTHMGFLPAYAFQLIEAAEVTGQLKVALRDCVAQMEYDQKIAGQIQQALMYPSFLIASAVGVVIFMFSVVVPRFAAMVKGHAEGLPIISRLVLGAGVYFQDHFWLLISSAVALGTGVVLALRRPALRLYLYDRGLGMPLIGPWLTETETARWTAMMATLLSNRISLLQALVLARAAVVAPSLASRLAQVEKRVRGGAALSKAMIESVDFPTAVINLIRVGEQAGNLAEMLQMAATMAEESTRTRMSRVLAVIEPASVVFIGGIVGVIVVALFSAITSANQVPL